jgi:hypothetical protein
MTNQINAPRQMGRSVMAVLVGVAVGIAVTIGTDVVLHLIHVYPPWDQPVPDRLLLVATAYRAIYGIASSYIIAYLAPYKPIAHAMVGGGLGLVASVVGAVATWNSPIANQSHWYAIALAVLALPQAWLGGWLRSRQLSAAS